MDGGLELGGRDEGRKSEWELEGMRRGGGEGGTKGEVGGGREWLEG